MRILVVLQGPSGGGKSHIAQQLAPLLDAVVCSTDQYYETTDDSGSIVYNFDPKKLPEYHMANQAKAKKHMSEGRGVIVDNTNIECWQCRPYVSYAVENNIPVAFMRCDGKWPNQHGVPDAAVERMRSKMEDLTVRTVLASKAPWEREKQAA